MSCLLNPIAFQGFSQPATPAGSVPRLRRSLPPSEAVAGTGPGPRPPPGPSDRPRGGAAELRRREAVRGGGCGRAPGRLGLKRGLAVVTENGGREARVPLAGVRVGDGAGQRRLPWGYAGQDGGGGAQGLAAAQGLWGER